MNLLRLHSPHCCCLALITLALAVILTAACRPEVPYSTFQPVDPSAWSRRDTLRFTLPSVAEPTAYDALLALRLTDSYAYRDLWLAVEQRAHHRDTTLAHRDTLRLLLAATDGHWLSQRPVLMEHEAEPVAVTLKPDVATELLVYHLMPRHDLAGITDIGITLRPIAPQLP